jgi:hypothetical protein
VSAVHRILLDEAPQIVFGTEFVAEDPQSPGWPFPRFRLRIRTTYDSGVILDISNPRTLELLAAATRTLLRAYRDSLDGPPLKAATPPTATQRRSRPTPRAFPGI